MRLTGLASGIDVASLLPTRCLFSGRSIATFYAESLATTLLVPVVFALIVNALFWGHRVVGRQTPKEVVERRRIVTQVCLLFIHLTLPICAYAAVSALVSEEIDYGDGETRRFLRVEPAVATASSQYRSVTRVWAILGIFIYPLGVPALYYTLLKRFERVLHPTHAVAADVAGATKRRTEHAMLSLDYQLRLVQRRNKSLEHDAANIVQSFQFLWIDYEPRWYLWEIFEVLRRLHVRDAPPATREVLLRRAGLRRLLPQVPRPLVPGDGRVGGLQPAAGAHEALLRLFPVLLREGALRLPQPLRRHDRALEARAGHRAQGSRRRPREALRQD